VIAAALGILVASLIGSVHCAAMCGGFVCFYAGSGDGGTNAASVRSHAMYNLGRLISYLLLGALAGALGAGLSNVGQVVGIAHAATVVTGALMVGWAVSTIAAQRGVAIGTLHAPAAWQRTLGHVLRAIRTQPIATRAALTGLLTTLLPCGWLYVFVAMAGGSGSVRGGLTVMLIFWAGTVPAMLAVGIGAQSVFGPLRKRLPSLSAFAVLVMGVLAISGRLSMRDDQLTHSLFGAPSSSASAQAHGAMSHGH
jgi:sulfite exporter TauE/SafE